MFYSIFVKNFFGEHTFPHIQERRKRRKGGKIEFDGGRGRQQKSEAGAEECLFLPSSPSFPIFWMREISSAAKQPTVFLPFFLFLSSVEATPTILIIPELLQPKRGGGRRDYRTYFYQIIFRKREKVPHRQNQFYALLTRQAAALPFKTQQTINPRGLTKKGGTGRGGCRRL